MEDGARFCDLESGHLKREDVKREKRRATQQLLFTFHVFTFHARTSRRMTIGYPLNQLKNSSGGR